MLDLKKVEATIALLADETARLAAESANESKWRPGAVMAAAVGAGAVLAVVFIATLKLIQG